MPVTIRPTPHKVGTNGDATVSTSSALLAAASKAWCVSDENIGNKWVQTNRKHGREDREVLHSSFSPDLDGRTVVPYGNGFVDGIIRAFNQDLHLVVRPDDVWLAIMIQFSMYVSGNAEELRSTFVSHEGQKVLSVDVRPLSMAELDVGHIAQLMTQRIHQEVKDPELRDWMMPDFTTTTALDSSVAAFVMMGSMKAYFEYIIMCGCGFPSVTLEGQREDWETIATKAEKLSEYGGKDMAEWCSVLRPVLRRMVRSFDEPDDPDVQDFWLRACHEAGQDGSVDVRTLSGWITAFCFWDENGKRTRVMEPDSLKVMEDFRGGTRVLDRRPLMLDGVSLPIISPKNIPKAMVTVPVIVDDYGSGSKYETTVVAGQVGVDLLEAKTKVRIAPGWWMLQDLCVSL